MADGDQGAAPRSGAPGRGARDGEAARALLLHSGGAKTGTSALQNLLREGAGRLAAAGVTYAGAPAPKSPAEITSGNAPPLSKALAAGDRAEALRLVEGFMGGRALGLASSETLEGLDTRAWVLLAELAQGVGLGLRVVHVGRDPLPLLLSVYDQKLKRHGEARAIGDWARTHSLRVFGTLRVLDALARKGALALRGLRYEEARDDLAGAVLGALGLPPRLLDGLPGGEARVNRSLDRAEREVMRLVNAALGDRFSRKLSDRLIAAAPDRRPEPPEDPRLAALVRERHGADVAWANATFFRQGPGLALPDAGSGPAPDADPEPSGAEETTPERLALAWLAATAAGLRDDAAKEAARRLLEVGALPPSADPRVPADFDPVGYLLRNPSLLLRPDDPFGHWIRQGRAAGLRYRDEPTSEAGGGTGGRAGTGGRTGGGAGGR